MQRKGWWVGCSWFGGGATMKLVLKFVRAETTKRILIMRKS